MLRISKSWLLASAVGLMASCQQEAAVEPQSASYDANDPLLNASVILTNHEINGTAFRLGTIEEGKYLFDGDVLVDEESLKDFTTTGSSEESNLGRYAWPNKTIYYTFDRSFPYARTMRSAMDIISRQTGAKFVEGAGRGGYIYIFRDGSANYSEIGYTGRRQRLSLGRNSVGVAIHEMGHAMGLHHEHQRPDRDQYIRVYASGGNFNKLGYSYGDFDFESMMLYPSRRSWNGYDMTDLQGRPFNSNVETGYNKFSSGDLAGLRYLRW